jgi:hypothetical protein
MDQLLPYDSELSKRLGIVPFDMYRGMKGFDCPTCKKRKGYWCVNGHSDSAGNKLVSSMIHESRLTLWLLIKGLPRPKPYLGGNDQCV